MHSYEAICKRREAEEEYSKSVEEAKEALEKLSKHPETKIITRGDHPFAWRYVEDMFPRIAQSIQEMKVYKNENTAFCKKIKVPPHAGGIFFIRSSTILICWTKEKFADDVIICHEMLHYAAQLLNGGRMGTEAIEEDFAYSKSIKYLNLRGFSDDWIAKEYMLPYYSSKEINLTQEKLARPLTRKEREEAKERAIAHCKAVIDLELRNKEPEPPPPEVDRFDLI